MPEVPCTAFISYSREDSEFALRLARDLKEAGASVWIDQLDIRPGTHWDNAIENALLEAPQMLVVLSPASSQSQNVRNEISFALEQGKIVVPVIFKDCVVPLQLQRQNRIDFRADYTRGLTALLDHLRVTHPDQTVIDKAAEEEANRKAAWAAREAEARRLAELEERDKEAAQQKDAAESIAIEQAERRVREEAKPGPYQKAARTTSEAPGPERVQERPQQPLRGPGLFWNSKMITAAGFIVCMAFALYFASYHWSSQAGIKWIALNPDTNANLNTITGSSDGKILFTCAPSTPGAIANIILKSIDGGASWTKFDANPGPACQWPILSSPDGSHLWAPAREPYRIWISSDGGASWSFAATPATANPRAQQEVMQSLFRSGDGKQLWASGEIGAILESDDGGATWVWVVSPSQSGPDLFSISGTSDGKFLVAVGAAGIVYASAINHASWHVPDSGTHSDLSSVFVSSNVDLICAVGERGAIILSLDKGATWSLRHSGTTANLHGLVGSGDGKHLWAVGDSGTIDESDDSGLTWTLRASGTKSNLHAVFSSADGKHLWVAGDNGAILESSSGFY
jgi:photosystem II stability/assembly factor-like uncharacterized protein